MNNTSKTYESLPKEGRRSALSVIEGRYVDLAEKEVDATAIETTHQSVLQNVSRVIEMGEEQYQCLSFLGCYWPEITAQDIQAAFRYTGDETLSVRNLFLIVSKMKVDREAFLSNIEESEYFQSIISERVVEPEMIEFLENDLGLSSENFLDLATSEARFYEILENGNPDIGRFLLQEGIIDSKSFVDLCKNHSLVTIFYCQRAEVLRHFMQEFDLTAEEVLADITDVGFINSRIPRYADVFNPGSRGEKLAWRFGAFHHLDSISQDIDQALGASSLNDSATPEQQFVETCEYWTRDLRAEIEAQPATEAAERKDNIQFVNETQQTFLRAHGLEFDFDLYTRRLVLYFRSGISKGAEMDYFEFGVIAWILNWFVQGGHSKVFNEISIVSRYDDEYPHYVERVCPELSYRKLKGAEFESFISDGANCLHLTHGRSNANERGSVPGLGQGVQTDRDKMQGIHQYVSFPFWYNRDPEDFGTWQNPSGEMDKHDIDEHRVPLVARGSIEFIQNLEREILSDGILL